MDNINDKNERETICWSHCAKGEKSKAPAVTWQMCRQRCGSRMGAALQGLPAAWNWSTPLPHGAACLLVPALGRPGVDEAGDVGAMGWVGPHETLRRSTGPSPCAGTAGSVGEEPGVLCRAGGHQQPSEQELPPHLPRQMCKGQSDRNARV